MSGIIKISILVFFLLGTGFFIWGYFNIEKFNFLTVQRNIQKQQDNNSIDTSKEAIAEKINRKNDIPEIFSDVNAYLRSKNRKTIYEQNIPRITSATVLKKLDTRDKNFVIIDIREKYEQSLLKLDNYPNIVYIRFGDLINNNFQPLPKDTEIVIMSYTENREIAAASYLLSEGYSNVKILKGGLLEWIDQKYPTAVNKYQTTTGIRIQNKDISSVLPTLSQTDIDKLGSSSASILSFEPYPSDVPMLVLDSKTLENYISDLPKDKQYILSCKESIANISCWEATYFWYIAKDSINIIGHIINN